MPQNAQPLLQVSDLTKSYEGKRGAREQHHALSGVDFACGEGELVAVIGPSGAGKSTFLRCINRLIEPTGGRLSLMVGTLRICAATSCVACARRSP